jgi:carboxyl-terminal processing protease
VRLKKLELNPFVLGAAALVLVAGSFLAGDTFHGYLPNPFVARSHLDFSGLNDLYGLMQRNFDGRIDAAAALDGARKGLVAAGGDPYTTYMTADEAKELSNDLGGKLSGIGAEIGIKNNILTIIAPIAGTPAEQAGLRASDYITRINNEDTSNMSVDTAVSKIRGRAGTQVTLKIARAGTPEPFDVTITRADITVPSVTWSMKPGNIGYIKISRFGDDTTSLIDQAASALKGQGAKSVVLDLRNNGGGYLTAGVAVASEFLDQGQLVVEERTDGKSVERLSATGHPKLSGLPAVVLINGGSASASEIVAGALHDQHAARLLGEKSFGKGSVQEIKTLPGGAQLKVTVAHWYTPGGVNINKEGIKPDIEVKLTTDDYNASRDPQLDKALELLR